MTTPTDTLTYSEFTDQLREALGFARSQLSKGETIDIERAWEVYAADPAPWHDSAVSEGDPDNCPAFLFVTNGGPWWVQVNEVDEA